MGKIQILSPSQALKIAAGEVIERPAHVVKELIENALDANATSVSLYIEDTGKKLIRVVDNGFGMDEDDASACFISHATSKIKSLDDLVSVYSFGFRGEALASIAVISKVTLITKQQDRADDSFGTKVIHSDGEELEAGSAACGHGTDIQVYDLFFNTPVRKKFLKQDETEYNAIQSIFNAFCLSRPDVSFKLYRDNKLVLNAPSVENYKIRSSQIWDYNFSQNLLPLVEKIDSPQLQKQKCKISGYISHHQFWRYGRQNIFFFVNGRAVKNADLSKALMKGYLGVLPPKRFPAALVFIEIEQQYIDVNVHPKKEEVRFAHPGAVTTALFSSVKKTLEEYLSSKLHADHSINHEVTKQADELPERKTATRTEPVFSGLDENTFIKPQFSFRRPEQNVSLSSFISEKIAPVVLYKQQEVAVTLETLSIIGQLFKTYILIEKKGELIVVDQHAAHERILYEQYKDSFYQQDGTTLMFPEMIRLQSSHILALLEVKDFFKKQGIDFEQMSNDELVVRTCPPQVKGSSIHELLADAAAFIDEHKSLNKDMFCTKFNEYLHGQMACKSAVKAGDILTLAQMQKLIDDLHLVENRFICVHGRPTMWTLSQFDLEKNFRRR